MKKSISLLLNMLLIVGISYSTSVSDSLRLNDDPSVLVKKGTEILLEIAEDLSSKNAKKGQLVKVIVYTNIVSEGKVVMKTGQLATARVKRVKKAKGFGRAGLIELEPLHSSTIDESIVLLTGAYAQAGSSKRPVAVAFSIIPTAICMVISPPTAPLFLCFGFLAKGKEAEIKQGTLMRARILKDEQVKA